MLKHFKVKNNNNIPVKNILFKFIKHVKQIFNSLKKNINSFKTINLKIIILIK